MRDLPLGPGRLLTPDLRRPACWDSSGVAALRAARRLAQAAGAEPALAAVPPHTLRILHLVGLGEVFTFRDTPATGQPPAAG